MYRILLLIIPFGLYATPVELKLNQDIKVFVKDYCVSCHNEKKDKGDIRLDNVSFSISNDTEASSGRMYLIRSMPATCLQKKPRNIHLIKK